ncbi:MAG: bifunctional 3,4-dihydroxy-2-butanone-4-phosphate synthase/GTP cyclohydrolase II, partial [Egibacteraceae bacterium]
DGLDTVEANLHLGFGADQRDYSAAIFILEDLGVKTIRLLTNNPAKVAAFEQSSIRVDARVPLVVPATELADGLGRVPSCRHRAAAQDLSPAPSTAHTQATPADGLPAATRPLP